MVKIPHPPDPRPSKADELERKARKKLEEKHGGFTWMPYVGLGLTGLLLAMNVPKEVEKCEKKHMGSRDNSRDRSRDHRRDRDHDRDRNRGHRDRDRERGRRRDGDGYARGRQRDSRRSWAPDARDQRERDREPSWDPYWDRRREMERRWAEDARLEEGFQRLEPWEWEALRNDRRHSTHYAR